MPGARSRQIIAEINNLVSCPWCRKKFSNPSSISRHVSQAYRCRRAFRRHRKRRNLLPHAFTVSEEEAQFGFEFGDNNNQHQYDDLPPPEESIDLDDDVLGPTIPVVNTEYYPGASRSYGINQNFMGEFDSDRFSEERKENPYYPFASKMEWEFVCWLSRSHLSMALMNLLLELKMFNNCSLSFSSAKVLRSRIEMLPSGPKWSFETIPTLYPTKYPAILYYRDPIDCLKSIFSNPLFQEHLELVPYRQHKSGDGSTRIYKEWMSGDVAWNIQSGLPAGATLLGAVLSSDKTTISAMTGDRVAYPLLLSLANIKMGFRMKGSRHAYQLLALLPVAKFIHYNKRACGLLQDRLTHWCLDYILAPLKRAAAEGIMMTDSLGHSRLCFTPLAAYIVDTPEAAMLTGVAGKTSPFTLAMYKNFGDSFRHPPRTGQGTLTSIKAITVDPWIDLPAYLEAALEKRLNGVHEPFWRDWVRCDPSTFFPPEMLHHWHKYFWDHEAKWCIRAVGHAEIDFRFAILHILTGYQQFKGGISQLKQVTGRTHREIQRYIIPIIAGAVPREFLLALRYSLEFRYLAQAPTFDTNDCLRIHQALANFHKYKQSILDIQARVGKASRPIDHFEIPKLESTQSVVPQIMLNGAPMQWSADVTENAHITFVKDPARETNNQNYDKQICLNLDRKEKVRRFDLATSIREAGVVFGEELLDDDADDDEGQNYVSSTSDLIAVIDPATTITSNPRAPVDYFKEAARLNSGESLDVPRPFRTISVGSTALHLTRDPTITRTTVDAISLLFNLPDFRAAIGDYLRRYEPDKIYGIGGRRLSTVECELPFSQIQVFCKLRMQCRSFHHPHNVLNAQSVHAWPVSLQPDWPAGRHDAVLLNTEPNFHWPSSGIQGHTPAQVEVIFRAILPRQTQRIPALDNFLVYVHRYDIVSYTSSSGTSQMDPMTGMYHLKTSRRSNGERLGDVVPLTQFRMPIHLVAKYGEKADNKLSSRTSISYSNELWLNTYFDKEAFYCFHSRNTTSLL